MNHSQHKSAANAGGHAPPVCIVCKKPVTNDAWLRYVPQNPGAAADSPTTEVLLCSPACAFRYFGSLEPGNKSFEPSYDGYEHSPGTARKREQLQPRGAGHRGGKQ